MKRYAAAVAVLSLMVSGCASDSSTSGKRGMTNMETGAIIGAAGGAVVGAVAYKKNRTAGAIVGAVGGGLAGGTIGAYMDSQKKDLDKNLRRDPVRFCARRQMPNNVVRIHHDQSTAFDTNSTAVKPGFYSTMDKVADVVIRLWQDDADRRRTHRQRGSPEHNQKLSQERCSVSDRTFRNQDVNPARRTLGKGEGSPIASNDT